MSVDHTEIPLVGVRGSQREKGKEEGEREKRRKEWKDKDRE